MTRPGALRRSWRLLAGLLTPPTPNTTPTVEDPVTDTRSTDQPATDEAPADVPGVPVADRLRAVEAELAELSAAASADPVTAEGVDLDRWRSRDTARRDRSAVLAQRLRDLREYGGLLDEHDAPIRAFLAVAGPLRHRYAELGRVRTFQGRQTPPPAQREGRRDLTRWCEALGALARALPSGDDEAREFLVRQWAEWFAARDGWARAVLGLDRGLLPAPEIGEDGALPAGVGYGVHLLDDPTARQADYRQRPEPVVESQLDQLMRGDVDQSDLRTPGRVIR